MQFASIPYLGAIMAPRFVTYIYFLLMIIGIFLGLINYGKLNRASRLITQLLFIAFLTDVYIYLPFEWITTNLPLFHFFAITATVYFGLIYHAYLIDYKKIRKILLYSAIGLALLSAINSFFIQSVFAYPSRAIMIMSFFVVPVSLIHFYLMTKSPGSASIFKQSSFWFNCGNLIFYSINFFIFGYVKTLTVQDPTLIIWTDALVQTSGLILYGSYTVSIYLNSEFQLSKYGIFRR